MSGPDGDLQHASSGGVSGMHTAVVLQPLLVAPATEAQFNTIRLPLISVGCWRVDDIRFAFDSSFVSAAPTDADDPEDIRQELLALKNLVDAHPRCPLAIFGHADPVGDDTYNKSLSERRARAIYALLIFKTEPDTAVKYWQSIAAAENWGPDQQSAMRDFAGTPSLSGGPLMRAYLQKLSEPGPTLAKTDFLAQGAGTDRKGDFQGCSEFNPLLIFSENKQAGFDEAKQKNDAAGTADRNAQNSRNRRVMVLLFKPGSKVDPAKWPCPRASEGIKGCKDRFWSDGESRRSRKLPDTDRKFLPGQDTFACRFYQRLSGTTCEQGVRTGILLINELGVPLANTNVQITAGELTWPARTDVVGMLQFEGEEVAAGTEVLIEVDDRQEGKLGDATTTPSGHHFKLFGP